MSELATDVGIPDARVPAPPTTTTRTVHLERVAANPLNARDVHAHPDRLAELAESLRQHGQLQPCMVVTRAAFVATFPDRAGEVEDADYVQVTGGRRRAAARLAGITELDVTVRDALAVSPAVFVAATAAENIDREDYDPVEEATQVLLLVEVAGNQKGAAEQLGRTPAWVTQRLNLLKLVEEVRDAIRSGEMPVREVRDLHRATRAEQLAALRRWRAQVAARERREQPDQPASPRRSRATARVLWLQEDYAPTVAAVRAELPAAEVRAVAERARAFADELLRDLDDQ